MVIFQAIYIFVSFFKPLLEVPTNHQSLKSNASMVTEDGCVSKDCALWIKEISTYVLSLYLGSDTQLEHIWNCMISDHQQELFGSRPLVEICGSRGGAEVVMVGRVRGQRV